MRRESSTVIALVGRLPTGLLAALAEPGNVSVVRTSSSESPGGAASARPNGPVGSRRPTRTDQSTAGEGAALSSWDQGARDLREAARRRATYVVVASDPLAGVASAWRDMWDVASGPGAVENFEAQTADTLSAWRGKQFELPDYYVVVAPADDSEPGPDLYLGPLRAARPRRVAFAGVAYRAADPATGPALTASLLDTLRSLEHGPWWPPLDDLLDSARHFYAGGLAEPRKARYS